MSGTTIFVIVIVVIFLGGMIGMLLYVNGGKDDAGKDQVEKK